MTIRKAVFAILDRRGTTRACAAFVQRTLGKRHAGQLLLYSAGIVALLLLLASWIAGVQRAEAELHPYYGSYERPELWETLALADIFALVLLGIGLLVVVPAAIASSVAGEQRSGTLEQLRTTPLRPLGLLLGLVLGAPARLYLICVGPLLLHLVAGLLGGTPLHAVLMPVLVLAVGGLAFGLVGAAVGLTQRGRGAMVTLGLAAISAITALWSAAIAHSALARWAFLHPWGAVHAQMLSESELYRQITMGSYTAHYRFTDPDFVDALALAPLLALVLFGAASVVIARASCRRLAAPQVPLLSKLQALMLYSLAAAAVVLPSLFDPPRQWDSAAGCAVACQLLLLPFMTVLAALATPGHDLWAINLRRMRRPGAFSDEAPPHLLCLAMIGAYVVLTVPCFASVSGSCNYLCHRMLAAAALGLVLTATLPIYIHFGASRFVSHRTRTAYVFGIIAHLGVQVAAVLLIAAGAIDGRDDGALEVMFVKLALTLAAAVPAWVLWRQRALRERTLAPVERC
jgi:hypothetical protein